VQSKYEVDISELIRARKEIKKFAKDNVDAFAVVNQRMVKSGDATALMFDNMGRAMNTTGKKVNTMGMRLQQAGYQVGDFAVQVQSGTNVAVAFGQQMSQLLGVLGPYGALAGAGVAIGTAIIAPLLDAKKQAQDTQEAIDNLADAVAALDDETLSDLQKQFGSGASVVQRMRAEVVSLQADIAKLNFDTQVTKLAEKFSNTFTQTVIQSITETIPLMGGLTTTPEEYMKSLGLDPTIMGTNFLDAFYAAIKAGDPELAEDLFYQLTDAINMQEVGMNGLTIKGKEFVIELADMVERAAELQKNLDKAAKFFNRTDEGLSDAEYNAMLAYQAYGESRIKGAKTKPRSTKRKGRDPVNAKDYAEQLVRQVALEQRLIGMSQEQADFANIMFDLKERNKKADIKLSEQQIRSYADQISKVREVIRQQKEMEAQYEAISNMIGTKFEDAMMSIVDGTKSVEDAFRIMASEIIKELYRVLVVQEMVANAKNAFSAMSGGGSFLSGFFGGFKADGGSVSTGKAYVVGERGPELFVPNSSGTIVPNDQMGGNGVTVVQNISISTGVQQTVRSEIRQLMPQIAESAKAAVLDSKRRGGNYGRALA
jgi:hypothetical protein